MRHSVFRRLIATLCLAGLAMPAMATLVEVPVDWSLDGAEFSGVLVYDDANAIKRPGIVMVPNWMGVTDDAVATAKRLAGHAHVVLVADVYGKGTRPADAAQAKAEVGRAWADGGITLRKRVAEAVLALQAQSGKVPVDTDRIGAVGFCFGGSAVLELARTGAPLAGVVSVHGGLDTHLPQATAIAAPVLVLNGADDAMVTDAQIAAFGTEMKAANADWQFVDFGGARHCFAEPENAGNDPAGNCVYDERAATRAFRSMADFFREQFAAR
ncbi:MAG TPA: dienelactone hydrolase family protein [Luteimonas sp.]|nr:dienelactone hydrolase family protein [Luteimonas sp.]